MGRVRRTTHYNIEKQLIVVPGVCPRCGKPKTTLPLSSSEEAAVPVRHASIHLCFWCTALALCTMAVQLWPDIETKEFAGSQNGVPHRQP